MSFLFGLWKNNMVKLAVITAAVLLFFRYVLPFLAPFFIAFLFVLIFRPLLKRIHKKVKLSEGILTGLLLGLFAVELILGGWFGFCRIMDMVGDFRQQEDFYVESCRDALHTCCDFIGTRIRVNPRRLEAKVMEGAENLVVSIKDNFAPKALNVSYSYAGTVFEWGFGIVITVIAILLLMKDYDSIRERLAEYRIFIRIKKLCLKIIALLKIYVKAQCIIVLCVATTAMAGLFACGIERWFLWGILTGILDMLPFVGSGIVLLPVAVFSFIQGKIWSGVGCLAVYGICAFLRQILEPKLIGDKINMYPILILLSVFFGLHFYNIGGIVLGPVSLFLIREIYCEVRETGENRFLDF